MARFRRNIWAAEDGLYRTPRSARGMSPMMMSALKMTADRIADSGEARCMMLRVPRPTNTPANIAGMIAKYLAMSLAMENVVSEPRVMSSCLPIWTISMSLVGLESRSTMLPASLAADVGVAMNTGTSAAKEAGNMVDLDSNPTKLIEIVQIGKQLLITRGSLTTFSIANDVAKYFAIIPAMFVSIFPGLQAINIMRLHSPQSAILSVVIFNALIILALVPLALRGVKYRPMGASAMLNRNLLVYGLGGIIAPFIGIKLIDLLVALLPGLV